MMKSIQYPSRGHSIFGYAHVPDVTHPAPALILGHGFTGAAHENSRLFVRFANRACAQGFYVLRIDFLGSGNSDADFLSHTYLSGWVTDMLAGVDFLRSQPEVDPARIGALGISFGGAAALLAGEDARIHAVAGWAPVLRPTITFSNILGQQNWDYLASGGEKISHEYAGAYFSVSRRFVLDLQKLDIEAAVRRYGQKPLLIMQGEQDTVIDPTHAAQLLHVAPHPFEYHAVAGESHSFCVHAEENFATTLDFFHRHL